MLFTQHEKDLIVERTHNGIADARVKEAAKPKNEQRRTQTGNVKVNGTHSILQKRKPKPSVVKNLKKACHKHNGQTFGLSQLAAALGQILHLKTEMSRETARRMKEEIKHY
jgi:hypothetical protein